MFPVESPCDRGSNSTGDSISYVFAVSPNWAGASCHRLFHACPKRQCLMYGRFANVGAAVLRTLSATLLASKRL